MKGAVHFMKQKAVRILSAILCITIIFTAVCLTRVELHGAGPTLLLFYNDRVWTQNSSLSAQEMHGVYYAPISLFVQLPSVDVRMNHTLQTFIITHGEKYLSFDISSNFAANQDKERMYLKTMEYNNERYVPMQAVCDALELGFEKYVDPTTSSIALRITDSAQTQKLEALAKSRYPGYFPETTEKITESTTTGKDTADTSGKDTTEADTTPVLSRRTVYITVDSALGEYTYDILAVLKKYNFRATFFITEENMRGCADKLSAIAAGGHAIAVGIPDSKADTLTNAQELLVYIESQNDMLARIIKQKTHIVRKVGNISAEQVTAQGYVLWGANVNISSSLSPSRAANQAINGIWNNEIAQLRFSDTKNTAVALENVLKFISQNRNVCDVRIISAALEN